MKGMDGGGIWGVTVSKSSKGVVEHVVISAESMHVFTCLLHDEARPQEL